MSIFIYLGRKQLKNRQILLSLQNNKKQKIQLSIALID